MKTIFEKLYRYCLFGFIFLALYTLWLEVKAASPEVGSATNRNSIGEIAKSSQMNAEKAASNSFNFQLTFGLDRVEFLQPTLWGNPRWKYVASLLYILAAFIVAKFFDMLIHAWLKQLTSRRQTKLDKLLIKLVEGPVKIVCFVVLLHVGLNLFSWPHWVGVYISMGLKLVVAISLTYVSLRFVDIMMNFWKERAANTTEQSLNEQLHPIIQKGIKIFIVLIAVLVTSQNLGLDITGILASLSIGGLAVGLAAQDTLANLFGAVAIYLDRPFQIGDRIKLEGGVDGMVEGIGIRSTRVRNLDGHLITIPNKTMGNATITNVQRRPNIKTQLDIGITYDSSPEKIQLALQILDNIYRTHPMTHDVIICFNKFADSALNISVIHWWKDTDYKAYLAGMQAMNLQIKDQFDRAQISFAFPSQTVYLKQDSSWQIAGLENSAKK